MNRNADLVACGDLLLFLDRPSMLLNQISWKTNMSLYDIIDSVEQSDICVREALIHTSVENSAIQRLKARVLAETKPSEVISSFDRMHHRHNRS